MDRIITYQLDEHFIENLAQFLVNNFAHPENDFSRVACVFGGKRPNLFLRRQLARIIKKPFYPPPVFSADEFVTYIISGNQPIPAKDELDACYLIYLLAKKISPDILRGRETFSEFLPWASEIVSFIEQLDLEAITSESLRVIQSSAHIGYDVPENVNKLLQHIIKIREAYHCALKEKGQLSRGLLYARACEIVRTKSFEEFNAIIFCNFFYMHTTEQCIIKSIYESGKGVCIFQGSEDSWSVLKNNAKHLGVPIKPQKEVASKPELSIRAGFDLHSQICFVRETLKEIKDHGNTVIVVPRPETVVPLLFEISPFAKDFNVSMGYPLKRSSLYALFKAIFQAQETKKGDTYYTRDYLEVLHHPLVKNIRFFQDQTITRVLVHKVEEVLTGKIKTALGGSLFISLASIETINDICYLTRDTLRNMNITVSIDELAVIVKEFHKLFFYSWDTIANFADFSRMLGSIIDVLLDKSMIASFPFNVKILEKFLSVKESFETLSFGNEPFAACDMREIFLRKLDGEKISFVGSPLKGLQILGLFETRSLHFENVIVMDANESILPKLKIYEPLIPREVMLNLGLNRLEKEEEIQRYQFMSLLAGAKKAYVIYEENQIKEKSRFIEELLWRKQKQLQTLDVVEVPKAVFSLELNRQEKVITKSSEMLEALRKDTYSASRLNVYLECPLQFYYKYVLGLSETEDLLDEPEARDVGDFIHELLEVAFRKFVNKKPVIDKEFKAFFWNTFEEKFSSNIEKRMKSDAILLKGIIKDRLGKFLEEEARSDAKMIVCLEEEFRGELEFCSGACKFLMKVDRIDESAQGTLNIIDYKTGKIDRVPKRLEQLEVMGLNRESIKENIKSFQLPLYYCFVQKKFPEKDINAYLYSIRNLQRHAFIAQEDYGDREHLMEICLGALEYIYEEIIDPHMPFNADKEENRCQGCAFSRMCK
ncbi:MAG: PD-(D/E)XK nuclease family protein [Candidatus Omnitrophota bacterium]